MIDLIQKNDPSYKMGIKKKVREKFCERILKLLELEGEEKKKTFEDEVQ